MGKKKEEQVDRTIEPIEAKPEEVVRKILRVKRVVKEGGEVSYLKVKKVALTPKNISKERQDGSFPKKSDK